MVKSPQRFAERVPHKSGRGSAPKPPLTAKRLRAVAPIVWELMRSRKKLLALGFLLMAINRVSGLVLPYSTRYLIDSVVAKHHIELLKPIVLAVLTATVIQGITSFSLTQLLSKAAQRLITELREKVQRHISRLPVSFYDANKTGNLVSRIMTDVEGVRNLLGTGLVELAGGLLTSLIALVVLLRISALMTVLAFGFLLWFCRRAEQGIQHHPADFSGTRQDQRGSNWPAGRIAGRSARDQGLSRRRKRSSSFCRRRAATAG